MIYVYCRFPMFFFTRIKYTLDLKSYFFTILKQIENENIFICFFVAKIVHFVYCVLKNNEKYYDSTTNQSLSHQVTNSIDYTSQLRGAWQESAICCQKLLIRERDATNFLKIQFECQQIPILWFSILCKMYKNIFMNSSGKLVIIIVVEKGRDIKFLMWYIAVNLFLKHYLLQRCNFRLNRFLRI